MKPIILLERDAPASDGTVAVRALLRIEGQAPDGESRIPLNLSLVLDRSGSMAGEKLEAAQGAARTLVQRLWPEDLVSVVAYDDAVTVVAPPSRGADAPDLTHRIAAITHGGMTNLSGGWLKGQELVAGARARGKDGMNRIVLLTDGLANVGHTDPVVLTGLCSAAAREGVTTTTVGFGAGFDERLLAAMADAGGGNTYYIERADQAGAVFEEELAGLLSLTAQNLSVEVRPAADARLVAVHHSYPRTTTDAGLRLEIGDLYAREPRSLLVEFSAGGPAGADALELGTLVIRADVLTEQGAIERREVSCPVRMIPGEAPTVEPEIRREMTLLEAGRAREQALERESRGDYGGASDALRSAAMLVHDRGFAEDERLGDEAADLAAMADLAGQGPMSIPDRKYLGQRGREALRSKQEAYKAIKREDRR